MKYSVFLCNLEKSIFAFIAILLSVVFLSGSPNASAQTVNGSPTLPAIQNTLSNATNNWDKAIPNDPTSNLGSGVSQSGVILKNSTVELDPAIYNDPNNQNNFYPGDTVNMLALIEAQGTGQDYVDCHVKIYLSKDVFRQITDNDISTSNFLSKPAHVTETDTDWVVNLDLNTVPSGAHIGIPLIATLKPGKIHNNKDYKVPSEYYDSKNDLVFKTDQFAVHTRTNDPTVSGPGAKKNIDAQQWDTSDTLKAATDVSVDGAGFYYSTLSSLFYSNESEPGDYTVTVQLPANYKVPANGSGNWTYDSSKNTLTQKITLDTTSAPDYQTTRSLGSFTLTVPKGYKNGTEVSLPTSTTGPNGDVTTNSYYLQLELSN